MNVMNQVPRLLATLLLTFPFMAKAADNLHVYPLVPGLPASSHYEGRVRTIGGEGQDAFAWQTECKKEEGCFDTLEGWTHTLGGNLSPTRPFLRPTSSSRFLSSANNPIPIRP